MSTSTEAMAQLREEVQRTVARLDEANMEARRLRAEKRELEREVEHLRRLVARLQEEGP